MIYEVEGDLLLSRAQLFALGVATYDPMTRGFAKKLSRRYPALAEAFRSWCEESSPEPGDIWLWGEPGQQQVVCLLTHEGQEDSLRGGRPDRVALNRALRALVGLYNDMRFKSLAMPPIGAGDDGLDWALVRDMMHAQLGELLIPIFVYTQQLEGQFAHEPGL